jgi:hypothetical protein
LQDASSAQATSDAEIVARIQSLVDAEMKVLNGEDGDAAIGKLDLDEEEKVIAQDSLNGRKILRDFRIKRRLRKELTNYRATVQLVKSETKGNRRFLEVLIVEQADPVAEDLRTQGLQYSSSKTLEFVFNIRKQKLRISNKREIGSQEELSRLQASPGFKLPDNAVELDKEEYLRGLVDDGTQVKANEKILPTAHELNPSFSEHEPGLIPEGLVAQVRTLNRSVMSSYMTKWVQTGLKLRNPAYRQYAEDCTNFASQVLEAGGWPRVGSAANSPTDLRLWWTTPPSLIPNPPHQSETWTIAPQLYQFINASNRATPVPTVSTLGVGDIIFADWGPDSRGVVLGITHTMIVCAKSGSAIYVCYHSQDTSLKPMSELLMLPKAKYYCWRLKDSY